MTLFRYCAIPIVERMTMIERTTSSSMMVKPRSRRFTQLRIYQSPNSPVSILRPIERRAVDPRVHVEHVLAAPAGAVRRILVRALAPLLSVCQRVHRDAA